MSSSNHTTDSGERQERMRRLTELFDGDAGDKGGRARGYAAGLRREPAGRLGARGRRAAWPARAARWAELVAAYEAALPR